MRTFVMGDIHGSYSALVQCLQRSNFDYGHDCLIQLGDIVDGYPESYECVEELLKINNLISILGNHDEWFSEFISTDLHPQFWTFGGKGTLISYLEHAGKVGGYRAARRGFKTSLTSSDIPSSHRSFFSKQKLYHVDAENRCFVHAGFNNMFPFYQQERTEYLYNRSLWQDALLLAKNEAGQENFYFFDAFKEIYIGHTPTTNFGSDKPLHALNIINVDTGAGHSGRLTIMDIDSKEFWQSDRISKLYPTNFREY